MARGVFVVAEQRDGAFVKVTKEAVSQGRRLADRLGTDLVVGIPGAGIEDAASELARYGADKLWVVDHATLAQYTTESYTDVLAGLISTHEPEAILIGATTQGRDLAARLAARLEAGLAMDCIDIQAGENGLMATRFMFGGKLLADLEMKGAPAIFAIRPNVMPAEPEFKIEFGKRIAVRPPDSGNIVSIPINKKGEHLVNFREGESYINRAYSIQEIIRIYEFGFR